MKKLLTLGLSLALALTLLAACGGGDAPASTPASTPADSSAASESDTSVPEVSTPETESDADNGEVPVRGTWDGNLYTNDFTGLSFTAPDDWMILTDEQLAEAVGISAENMQVRGEAMTAEMLEQSTIYDACAASTTTGTNVIMAMENLTANHPLGQIISPEAYCTATVSIVEENFPDVYTFGDPYKQTIGDREYTIMEASAPSYELTQYYMVRKVGNYMEFNNITVMGDDTAEDVFAMFS